eukprot:jgi/Galph1/296/GphlegSOOS_G5058.1
MTCDVEIVKLASRAWLEKQTVQKDNDIINQLFPLTKDSQGAVLLNSLQYIEQYLWPCFVQEGDNCSDVHLLSTVNLVCENCRTIDNCWTWLTEEKHVEKFFNRIVSMVDNDVIMNNFQKERIICFFLLATRRADLPLLRKITFSMVSLPLYLHISPTKRQKEFDKYPQLKKPWKKILMREEQLRKSKETYLEADFIPNVAADCEKMLVRLKGNWVEQNSEKATSILSEADDSKIDSLRYVERILELFIELLSQLPTRRFFITFLRDFIDTLQFYERFPIDDDLGEPLSHEELLFHFHEKIVTFQKIILKHIPHLKDLAIENASKLTNPEYLSNYLKSVSLEDLLMIADKLDCLPFRPAEDGHHSEFILACIVDHICSYPWRYEAFHKAPLSPTEKDIWDETLLSLEDAFVSNEPLALPKLNLQYLSIGDFILRNFTLYRMEIVHTLRQEIEDALERLNPDIGDMGLTCFRGWARMMLPLQSILLKEKGASRLDSEVPEYVKLDISIDLSSVSSKVRQEWDNIMQHDVLFLLSIQKPYSQEERDMNEDMSFMEKYGVVAVRTFQVIGMLDKDGNFVPEVERNTYLSKANTQMRNFRGYVEAAQFQEDVKNGMDTLYSTEHPDRFNLVLRRKSEENNFKGVLEALKDIFMKSADCVPRWLLDTILGYSDDKLKYSSEEQLNLVDTFVSLDHLEQVLSSIHYSNYSIENTLQGAKTDSIYYTVRFNKSKGDGRVHVVATPYKKESQSPFPTWIRKRNKVWFTSKQVEAIMNGIQKGLSLVVGPPGTGKTDVAVQIISNLYHSSLRNKDIDPKDILRLGHGEEELGLADSFSREGRVNYMLQKRLEDLQEIHHFAQSLMLPGDYSYSCENAHVLFQTYFLPLKEEFFRKLTSHEKSSKLVADIFPFTKFFSASGDTIFRKESLEEDLEVAKSCFHYLERLFQELEACRPFELLRNQRERGDFILLKQARIIAMTCTHAAIRRKDFIEMGFKYDTLVMEESAQVLEVETFIPMVLQRPDFGCYEPRLKRCVLLGDNQQLPPVVKNIALAKYCNLYQSMYNRFLRLGLSHVTLDVQGRSRSSICNLYRWCYPDLKDLPNITDGTDNTYILANSGFRYEYQVLSVGDEKSESQPFPFFYQNLVEAEYIAAVYQYMRLLGYPREKASQKHLLRDVIEHRISWNPSLGMPHRVTTVDKYQGQQNDYVLLSLVRTRNVGHLRDIRRWVVSTSRARLGLYIFCHLPLFQRCADLSQGLKILTCHPSKLELVRNERYGSVCRRIEDAVEDKSQLVTIEDCPQMAKHVQQMVLEDASLLENPILIK